MEDVIGGIGSGRIGFRIAIEDCLALPLATLRERGVFDRPTEFEIEWKRAAGVKLVLRTDEATVHVIEPFDQSLRVVHQLVHNGGYRPLFRCPRCGSLVTTLYLKPDTHDVFGCRDQCWGLTYRSCQMSGSQSPRKTAREIEKLDARIHSLEQKLMYAQTVDRRRHIAQQLIDLRDELDTKWDIWRERTGGFLAKVSKRYPALRAQLESPGVNKPLMEATDEELRRAFGVEPVDG